MPADMRASLTNLPTRQSLNGKSVAHSEKDYQGRTLRQHLELARS
ncbi:hypothetical protein ACQPT2_18125 [Erwinia amylovora]